MGSAIALGTAVAGTLDLAEALGFTALRGGHPRVVLQYISAGLLGRGVPASVPIELLGVAIHYAIAAFWTALFMLLSVRMPVLRRRAVACGLLYGLVIYAVMNLLVLPHSALHAHVTHVPAALVNGVLALMFCVGVPVALINNSRCAD